MMTHRFRLPLQTAVGVMVAMATASTGLAQSAEGPVVAGLVGVLAMDASSDPAFSVSAGYRFNRVFGMGVEITAAPSGSSDDDELTPFRGRPVDFRDQDGQVIVFTTNVRLEVPTTVRRIVPYAVAGGGVAHVEERFDAIILDLPLLVPPGTGAAPLIYPPPYLDSRLASATHLALTLGGGVSVIAVGDLAVDVDLRYLRLLGAVDRNVGRFGAGVSYRF